MERRYRRISRQGQIYRFTHNGADYAAFVWQVGKKFHGQLLDHPQVPHSMALTAIAARDALAKWLVSNQVDEKTA